MADFDLDNSAFALRIRAAFSIVYVLVAQGLRERSDTWLSGEAEVLAQVSADTPKDHLYQRIVREVAESATQEVPDERNARGERLNSVFFLATDPNNNDGPLWVGPGSADAFVTTIQRAKLVSGAPSPSPWKDCERRFESLSKRKTEKRFI